MVDFMERDDQEMIRIQEDILKCAAEHHLFIQFHIPSKPSGLIRTYPNEFTREELSIMKYVNGTMLLMQIMISPFRLLVCLLVLLIII